MVAFLVTRVGLLALMAANLAVINLVIAPLSADPSLWWTANSAAGWVPIMLLAVYSYRIAQRPAGAAA